MLISSATMNGDTHFCQVCQVVISGTANLESHNRGMKHLKRQNDAVLQGTVPPVNNETSPYHCSVCQVSMSGPESYNQHITGRPHFKKQAMSKVTTTPLRMQLSATASSIPPAVQLLSCSSVTTPSLPVTPLRYQGLPVSSAYRCDACNKNMTGIAPYQQHIQSADHIRKVALAEALQSPRNSASTVKQTSVSVCPDRSIRAVAVATQVSSPTSISIQSSEPKFILDEATLETFRLAFSELGIEFNSNIQSPPL